MNPVYFRANQRRGRAVFLGSWWFYVFLVGPVSSSMVPSSFGCRGRPHFRADTPRRLFSSAATGQEFFSQTVVDAGGNCPTGFGSAADCYRRSTRRASQRPVTAFDWRVPCTVYPHRGENGIYRVPTAIRLRPGCKHGRPT